MNDAIRPTNSNSLRELIKADLLANRRNFKFYFLLVAFRVLSYYLEGERRAPPAIRLPLDAAYRLFCSTFYSLELPLKTQVGPGLAIFHGFGTVINDSAVIGSRVLIRHGVTIGHAVVDGPCPIIGDGVEIGAGAIILGGVTIGADARIGAGSLVTHDVPAGSVHRVRRIATAESPVLGNSG